MHGDFFWKIPVSIIAECLSMRPLILHRISENRYVRMYATTLHECSIGCGYFWPSTAKATYVAKPTVSCDCVSSSPYVSWTPLGFLHYVLTSPLIDISRHCSTTLRRAFVNFSLFYLWGVSHPPQEIGTTTWEWRAAFGMVLPDRSLFARITVCLLIIVNNLRPRPLNFRRASDCTEYFWALIASTLCLCCTHTQNFDTVYLFMYMYG